MKRVLLRFSVFVVERCDAHFRTALLLTLFMMSTFIVHAQTLVKGKVTDESGTGLPGVNVVLKGTTQGSTTDSNGDYSVEVDDNSSVLVFSFIGYEPREVVVSGQSTINVDLQPSIESLAEVVVIGYGTANKRDLTGAVMSANLKDFEYSPNTNIVQSLQGTVPGLNIGQVTGAGATPSISIRGATTISGNTAVLIVLDGIIYNNSLASINPADIESIDVLKDASSTAVYGAQAANGVLLITTKKGKTGKTKITLSSSYTMQNPSKNLRPMHRDEMLNFVTDIMWNQAYLAPDYTESNPAFNVATWLPDPYMKDALGTSPAETDYDWWGDGTQSGSIFENLLSFTGGSESVSYMVSLGNVSQKNYLLNDDFKRNSVRVNLDAKPRKWLKVGTQIFGSFVNRDGAEPVLWTLLQMSPFATPFNPDGTLNPSPMPGTTVGNPLMGSAVDDRDRSNFFTGNLYSEFQLPVKGLTYRINFGNNYTVNEQFRADPYGNGQTGEAYKRHSTNYDYTFDNIVNYSRDFGRHNVGATFVYGAIERNYSYTEARGTTFSRITLGYDDLGLGTQQYAVSDAWSEALLYQMVRMNYKYNNKYLITATLRKDGYSGFAENHKSALFPSVALGWVISEEGFTPSWIDYLKIRGGWGVAGNQTPRYSSQAVVSSQIGYIFGDGGTPVVRQELTTLGNKDLKWEKTAGFNFGVDFNLMKDRIQGSLDVYRNTTHDLLYSVAIPTITGFSTVMSNIGELKNKGIEFIVTTKNVVSGDFEWSTTFNISSNSNEVVSLLDIDSDGDGQEDDLVASNLFIGKSLSSVYGYVTDGIYQLDDELLPGFFPGNYKIRDLSGNNDITADDRKILGKRDPAYRFGILNTFKYKDFFLSFFLNSVQGGKNGYLGENTYALTQDDNARRFNRISEEAKDFWSPANPNGRYSRSTNAAKITPVVFEDRSFIRLQDITLGYNLPKSLLSSLHLENVNVYLNGKNLWIGTGWKGWDPEANYGTYTNADGRSTNMTGSNYDGRPVMRSFTAGINVTF